MAMDLRQVIAAVLTFSMFMMLGNMIKKDHIDPLLDNVQHEVIKVSKQRFVKLSSLRNSPWGEDHEPLRPCWGKLSTKVKQQAKGYIFFSLENGPEYHASQISNAITIARHLGATLVLPNIRGSGTGEKRLFGEYYDINKFITSLEGVVQVAKDHPDEKLRGRIVNITIPSRVLKEFIAAQIEPIFKKRKQLRIASYHPLPNMTNATETVHLSKYSCLAMFGSLRLQPELKELVDSMVGTLRHLSRKSLGKFIAVDLRVEELKKNSCQKNATQSIYCYDAKEISRFLTKIGFERDTMIYLTQTGWHQSLKSLREYFPNTFTKDAIMPIDVKEKYLGSKNLEFDKLIDHYICSQSDVFVPSIHDLFQETVVGMRIALGKTQVLVPARRTSTSAADYMSPHISNKSHVVYSCLC